MSEARPLHNWLSRMLAVICTAISVQLSADEYSAGWGPAVGAALPALAAPDHTGVERTLADLSGDQGLLLFFSRSADW
ncbi:MAG: hypothetical protein ACFHXK_19790 [bacterium]